MEINGKINLYLTVGAERSGDHRHEIRTLFLPVPALSDTVAVRPIEDRAAPITCTVTGRSICCTSKENLCIRAARLFCQHTGIPDTGYAIALHKRIPVSAGFGGGSADAAAILTEMQRLTGAAEHPEQQLPAIAVQLGADVPYFLNPRPALATGIGDNLQVVRIDAPYRLVIAYPGMPSPVKWAYTHWHRPDGIQPPSWEALPAAFSDTDALAAFCWNDLAFALEEKYPLLSMIRECMMQHGAAAAQISGSGSGLFAFCKDDTAATQVRQALRENFTAIEVF